jgi:polyhydroxyalkanoate synthesis regulator phasin
MEQKIHKLQDSIVFTLNKLEDMGKQVRKQEEEIENYIKKNCTIDFNELVAAHLKSTKTTMELLREEIEELHQLTTLLFEEIRKRP